MKRCVDTGIAGLSIEDNSGRGATPLYEKKLAIERIKTARGAIDESRIPVVLTRRCEAWLVRHPNPLRTALDRLVAYAEAGADRLYAPGIIDLNEIEQIVKAVAPAPHEKLQPLARSICWPMPFPSPKSTRPSREVDRCLL